MLSQVRDKVIAGELETVLTSNPIEVGPEDILVPVASLPDDFLEVKVLGWRKEKETQEGEALFFLSFLP